LYWLTIPSGFAAKKKRQSPAELVNNNYTIPSTSRQLAMADIFSERLKAVRERRGYSQADLAKKAGLQATAISHFETGGRSPSFDNLRRLSDALNVSTDYLMGRSETEEMVGPSADSLFRGVEKLSADDQEMLRVMKDTMLKKKGGGA
jgi:transcriptional regulator with XRE-family HTH domain